MHAQPKIYYLAETSTFGIFRGRNVRGRNVRAETSVAEMSVAEMSYIRILPFNLTQRSGVCEVKVFASMLVKCPLWCNPWLNTNSLYFFPFNLICNMTTFRFYYLLTLFTGWECVYGQNMCLHGALSFIPFNLICSMTTFRKKKWPFDP